MSTAVSHFINRGNPSGEVEERAVPEGRLK